MPSIDDNKIADIFTNYSNLNFVQRLLNPGDAPIIKNSDGTYSTHKMAWAGGTPNIVYPTIVQDPVTGKLNELQGREAIDHALKTKEFIPFDTPEEADWFSRNYKRIWNK
jgi:hypothetical protein